VFGIRRIPFVLILSQIGDGYARLDRESGLNHRWTQAKGDGQQ
jgi:hypothetical protein